MIKACSNHIDLLSLILTSTYLLIYLLLRLLHVALLTSLSLDTDLERRFLLGRDGVHVAAVDGVIVAGRPALQVVIFVVEIGYRNTQKTRFLV